MNDGNSEKRHIGYLNILKRNIGQYGSDIDRIMAKLKNVVFDKTRQIQIFEKTHSGYNLRLNQIKI